MPNAISNRGAAPVQATRSLVTAYCPSTTLRGVPCRRIRVILRSWQSMTLVRRARIYSQRGQDPSIEKSRPSLPLGSFKALFTACGRHRFPRTTHHWPHHHRPLPRASKCAAVATRILARGA